MSSFDLPQVVIGGWENTKSVIRVYPQDPVFMDEASTPGILSCDESRHFWIAWAKDFIRVGTGSVVYDAEILSWESSDVKSIKSISISSGTSYDGLWQFAVDDGEWG